MAPFSFSNETLPSEVENVSSEVNLDVNDLPFTFISIPVSKYVNIYVKIRPHDLDKYISR